MGIAVSLLLCPASAHAQGGVPLWTNVFPGQRSFGGIGVDKSGNVFVNGSGITIKYSSDGLPLWTNLGGGKMAVDASDNVFVTGNGTIAYSSAGVPLWTNQPGGGAIALDSDGNVFVEDGSATIAYSSAGVPLWTNRHANISALGIYTIAVNSSDKVFVAGGGLVFPFTDYDYLIIAYSSGGVPLWTNRYNGGENDSILCIAVDRNDNVFVTGFASGYYATIKYSGAGVPLWTNRYLNGPWTPNDGARAIAVDSQGNVFVTGGSASEGNGEHDYATIKYSNGGVPLWTNRYDGPGQYYDDPSAIAVDSAGNVFVTGQSAYNLPGSPRPADYATIAYSNAGLPLWTNLYNGLDDVNSGANAIAVDSLGNVFIAGNSIDSNRNYHWTTIKYSSSVPPPVLLDLQKLNNELVLSWTNAGFNLQAAPFVNGPFTNLPAATSPYTNPLTAPQQFFRLAAP